MDSANKKSEDLKNRLDCIIEKSSTQTRILKKILSQLNKQNENPVIQKKYESDDDMEKNPLK